MGSGILTFDGLITMSQGNGKEKDPGETSGVIEDLINSFQQKISEMEKKSTIPYTRSTIISRSNTLTESVQNHQKPSLLSIGPLHRGGVNLQLMEDFKWTFLYVISINGFFTSEKLSVCFCNLKESEEQSRRAYSVFIDMTSDEFVQMLFLDACFIVLLTLAELDDPKKASSLSTARKDLLSHSKIREILTKLQSLNVDEMDRDVTRDMFILENQIPFIILEDMWKWFIETLDIKSTLDFLGCHCFVQRERIITKKIHHYLHLYHCSFVPPPSPTCELYDRYYRPWIPSATELKESGIKFELENPGDHLWLDITFKEGVVRIPDTFLNEDLRARVHNLVDFEQSVRGDLSTSFSNYVWIMSCLLSKEDDVRILSMQSSFKYQKGWDKDVQRFFYNLERRCSYWKVDDKIQTMFNEINDYRSSRLIRLKASIKRKLCSSLWVTLSLTGAIVLFILTFLQTFFAMYSYFHPPS